MYKSIISKFAVTLVLMAAGTGSVFAGGAVDKLITHARAAAPATIGAGATVVINGEVVVTGAQGAGGDLDA